MGEAYLVDTNVFSDYLENKFTVEGSAFFENIIISKAKISFINKIELQGHNLPNLSKYKAISESCEVIGITSLIIDKTISIRKSRKIKLPDAIIAAT